VSPRTTTTDLLVVLPAASSAVRVMLLAPLLS
jgi:hypothetical protein